MRKRELKEKIGSVTYALYIDEMGDEEHYLLRFKNNDMKKQEKAF